MKPNAAARVSTKRIAEIERFSVAFHEAAHAVAALDLGFKVRSTMVKPSGRVGFTEIEFTYDDPGAAAVVHMAGPAATELFADDFLPGCTVRSEGGLERVDWVAAACALRGHALCGVLHRRPGVEDVLERARMLVESRFGAIVGVAFALAERGRLSGREVARIAARSRRRLTSPAEATR